jgi:hypothetical protein
VNLPRNADIIKRVPLLVTRGEEVLTVELGVFWLVLGQVGDSARVKR